MKKQKFDPYKNLKLDSYEQEIEDTIDPSTAHTLSSEEKEKYARYAKYTKALTKKDARVSIRVNTRDLSSIRERASKNGLPYQTLITTILHQYAKGKIKVEL